MSKKHTHHRERTMGHGERHGCAVTHNEAELFELLVTVRNPFLLVLDCVQDPHNLGACLRTAAAVGVQAVIVPNRRAAPMTETVKRIACGGAENVFFAQITNLARTVRRLKEAGVRVIGTDHSAKRSLFEEDLTGPLALILGAEGSGLRHLTAEMCSALVSIPMSGSISCLNVSVAAGVCLFEAKRQRLRVDQTP